MIEILNTSNRYIQNAAYHYTHLLFDNFVNIGEFDE